MKKSIYIIMLITCSLLVFAEQKILSYTPGEEWAGGIPEAHVRFHAENDLVIERLRFKAVEMYTDEGELMPIEISITSKTLGNPITKVWEENYKISQCENVEQTIIEVLDKEYLYGPIRYAPENGWNYILLDEPITIPAGEDFFIEFNGIYNPQKHGKTHIQMRFSDKQSKENTFVPIENIKDKEYIGLPRNSYCLAQVDHSLKDKKINVLVEVNPPEYSKYKCVDSDGDKNYDVKGNVSLYIEGKLTKVSLDFCGENKVLWEMYCPDETSKSVANEMYTCPGICLEGACATPTVCPSKISLELNKVKLIVGDGPVVSIKTYDKNGEAIESIINVYLYKEDNMLEASALKVPSEGLKLDTKELIEDIGMLKEGSYNIRFDTSVPNCQVQSTEEFEIKESMNLWERFVNFLKSLFG